MVSALGSGFAVCGLRVSGAGCPEVWHRYSVGFSLVYRCAVGSCKLS